MTERRFPIQIPSHHSDEQAVSFPRSVPWSFVEPHREQIEKNHCGQTLERLVERWGLSPYELWCGVTGRDLYPLSDFRATWPKLAKLIEDHDG